MLTTTPFFVKTCFPKSFITFDLRTLTETALEVISRLEGIITCFFDNEERRGNRRFRDRFSQKLKPQREQNSHGLEDFA